MKVVNLTPHVVVVDEYPPIPISGVVARVTVYPGAPVDPVNGMPCVMPGVTGPVTGLPDPVDGTVYIVSAMVASASPRSDVYYPDSGPTAIRDEKGQIKAVRRLIRSV